MEEIFKCVVDFEGLYQVSNFGRVKSLRRNIIMKSQIDTRGYEILRLYKNKKGKTFTVHRLLAKAFIPNPLNKEQINHKNCNRIDNRLENLEWVTPKENIRHAFEMGRINYENRRGERVFNSKLKKEDVEYIRENYKYHDKIYNSLYFAKKFNVSSRNILRIVKYEMWKE